MAFLTLCQYSFATNYYVAANGNDNNSGTSTSSPWKTISKVNSFTFKAGDQILFNRGDEFYGGIVVKQSGTSTSPITFGAYGSGAKPVITGFTQVTSWTSLGGNIWESSGAVSTLSYTNMVTVNGVNTAMGRWPNSTGPNTGYLTIKSHSGKTSITSDQLTGSTNWKDADLIIRKEHFSFDRAKITAHSGSKLTFNSESSSEPKDGFGFFIQNDPKTLDKDGEWYYNPGTKKLRIYSTSKPQDVRIATVENLFYSQKRNYIVVQDISFVGSNADMINCLGYTSNLNIKNNDIFFSGGYGIFTSVNYATIENNKVYYANEGGIKATERYAVVRGNEIKNIYLFEGMNSNGFPNGIHITNENSRVENNQLDSCGFIGIKFASFNSSVKNNFVNATCLIRDDGAGISMGSRDGAIGSIIDGNIILNAVGAPNGTSDNAPDASGIMIDAWASGITIINNTVANCTNIGIKLHGTNQIVVRNNTTYNNGGKYWSKGGLELLSRADYPIRKLTIENNIFFAKTSEQYAMFGSPDPGNLDELKLFGTANNNYYAKPIDPATSIRIHATNMNAAGWSTYSGQDKNSKGAPKTIKDVNELRFEYNATASSKTIKLDANYIDVKGVSYNGSITLAPYSSAVLIRNGAISNQSPVANAGADQTITLPVNSVTLKGTGTDPDGTIASYNWSKLSGPSGGTIASPTAAQTVVSALIQGSYDFVLKVTDNGGLSAWDTVRITVKAAAPVAVPVANAGTNQQIVLPVSNVSLTGSATISDGKISSYKWSKISGPSQGSIENTDAASTNVTGLAEGIYVFQLKVTAENGQSSTAEVTVTVASESGLLSSTYLNNAVNGLNYKYYEAASYSSVPDFTRITPEKSGFVNNFDLSVATRKERFAMNFEGYIDVPSDGQYTFYVTSDDGSLLYIDGKLVVNHDGLHGIIEKSGTIGLKAGKHAISVGYFQQDWDAVLQVRYSGPGVSKQLVPASSLYRGNPVNLLDAKSSGSFVSGIDYAYFEASSYSSVPDFALITPVKKGAVNTIDISVANRKERFAMSFNGYIDVPTDGQYTFYSTSDDGSVLYIDDILLVDNDGLHGIIEKSGTIGLKAGKHAISVGYFQQDWDGVLQVRYSGPNITKQLIPATSLFRDNPVNLLPATTSGNFISGIDYAYYEASGYTVVPDFTKITPVKKGTLNSISISVANRQERFAMSFDGYIEVPSDGLYTFYSTSDDGSKIYIDGQLVVDNDGLHGIIEVSGAVGLKAGKHAISVGYFQQDWDGVLQVRYSGPGIGKQYIPSNALFRNAGYELLAAVNPGSILGGLEYSYYEQSSYSQVPDFSKLNPVKSGYTSNFDVSVANRKERYAMNFEGYIQIPDDGQYTFYTTSDDGSMLYIDGRLIVDNDGLHSLTEKSGVIGLRAGWHKISVGFFQQDWDGILQVRYAGSGITKQLIPSAVLARSSSPNSKLANGGGYEVGISGTGSGAAKTEAESAQPDAVSFATEIRAYPNPFINTLAVHISGKAGNYSVRLMDGSGRILKVLSGSKVEGTTSLMINTAQLPRGFYFLYLVLDDQNKVIKLQK